MAKSNDIPSLIHHLVERVVERVRNGADDDDTSPDPRKPEYCERDDLSDTEKIAAAVKELEALGVVVRRCSRETGDTGVIVNRYPATADKPEHHELMMFGPIYPEALLHLLYDAIFVVGKPDSEWTPTGTGYLYSWLPCEDYPQKWGGWMATAHLAGCVGQPATVGWPDIYPPFRKFCYALLRQLSGPERRALANVLLDNHDGNGPAEKAALEGPFEWSGSGERLDRPTVYWSY